MKTVSCNVIDNKLTRRQSIIQSPIIIFNIKDLLECLKSGKLMSVSSFVAFCGACLQPVTANRGGLVLSCSDFLCNECSQNLTSSFSCPCCGKSGIKSIPLGSNLPEEVLTNMLDPSKEIEKMHEIIVFQVRYYKKVIKLLHKKLNNSQEENNQLRW